MRNALRTGKEEHGITNTPIVGRSMARRPRPTWRPARGDVSLIAHVGYDIEAIGPFVDAMERVRVGASASPC